MFDYPGLRYSYRCCFGCLLWSIAALREKCLPLISQEGYRVAPLAFTVLQHPEMLGISVYPRLIPTDYVVRQSNVLDTLLSSVEI
jgi:hypothetical protein